MKGFVAAALAIVGMSVLYMHSSHDDANNLRDSFPSRQLRRSHPKYRFRNPSFTDPKVVTVKEEMEPPFISDITSEESAVLDESADINIWGTPAKLTSFGYKWRDDKCSNKGESERQPKKKRPALCLYGVISSYPPRLEIQQLGKYDASSTAKISHLNKSN